MHELDVAEAFHLHHTFIWRTLVCMGVPRGDADDLAQDVFLVAHRRRVDFDGRRPVRAWLYGIARGLARNHLRRIRFRTSKTELASEVPLLGLPASESAADDPERALARRRSVAMLGAFLDTLSFKLREVFVLSEIEGMTAPEVGSALGLKTNTVYSRVRLARRKFEKAVAQWASRPGESL